LAEAGVSLKFKLIKPQTNHPSRRSVFS